MSKSICKGADCPECKRDDWYPDAVTHFITANADKSGNVTACGLEQVYPMWGNGWRVSRVTCEDCSRVLCDLAHANLPKQPSSPHAPSS